MKQLLLVLVLVLSYIFCLSQTDQKIVGTWKGESICQIRPSACNDEIVVYHITKEEKENAYSIVMNKVVKGAEEDMATVKAIYSESSKQLEGYDIKWKTHWIFNVNGKEMNGVLVDKDGKTIFRKIHIERIKA